jgi:CDP-glucose 4,6-dehydratase
VLEPLSGYLWLSAQLVAKGDDHADLCSAFNFGPNLDSNRTVADVVQAILSHSGGNWVDQSDPHAVHEASKLNLAIDKAYHILGWKPVWDFDETIRQTAAWYLNDRDGADEATNTVNQIASYEQAAANRGVAWATAN